MKLKAVSILACIVIATSALCSGKRYNTKEGSGTASKVKPHYAQIPKSIKLEKKDLKLVDPTIDEFWNEGTHRPDEGIVTLGKELARLDKKKISKAQRRKIGIKYAKLWLIRMITKSRLSVEMHGYTMSALAELQKEGIYDKAFGQVEAVKAVHVEMNKLGQSDLVDDRLLMFFLFDPKCPNCHKLASTLKSFKNVVPMQVSGGNLHNFNGLANSVALDEQSKAEYFSTDKRVPKLVLFDPNNQEILVLTGNQPKAKIVEASRTLLAGGQE